jgi:hypothetical protein
MTRTTRRCGWWVVGAGLLVGVAASWPVLRLTIPEDGSLEDVFSRVHVGMRYEEAVAVLDHCDAEDWGATGTTKDGRTFHQGPFFETLPPAQEIEQGELSISDTGDHSVVVTLGQNGVVTGKRFEWGEPAWKYYWDRLRVAANSDLDHLRRVRRPVKQWLGLR